MPNALYMELPDEVMDFVRAEAAAKGLNDASSYVVALIKQERIRKVREELADLLDEGLRGEMNEITDADWQELRERIRNRSGDMGPGK